MSTQWRRADGRDVSDIVALAVRDFQTEVDGIFVADPVAYARNITLACVNQFYAPGSELLLVAHKDQQLVAYVWVIRQTAPWSDEPMAAVRMVHLDQSLSVRERVRLIREK